MEYSFWYPVVIAGLVLSARSLYPPDLFIPDLPDLFVSET
jgi:hypothetical protein